MQPTTILDNTQSLNGYFQLNNVLYQKSSLQFEIDAEGNTVKIYRFGDGSVLFNNLPFANFGFNNEDTPTVFEDISTALAYIKANCV